MWRPRRVQCLEPGRKGGLELSGFEAIFLKIRKMDGSSTEGVAWLKWYAPRPFSPAREVKFNAHAGTRTIKYFLIRRLLLQIFTEVRYPLLGLALISSDTVMLMLLGLLRLRRPSASIPF